MSALLAAALLGLAVALLLPACGRPPTAPGPRADATPASEGGTGPVLRHRLLLSVLTGVATATFIGGPVGLVAAPAAVAASWTAIGRVEPAAVRRERERLRHDLPHLVRLLGAALAAGAAPTEAAQAVADSLPGPAGERLGGVATRLRLGADPVTAWRALDGEPALAPLGRAMARGQAAGASVVAAVDRLADELARSSRAAAEDRARQVGVKAAVPLGICLLPAFVLIGIVPVVGGLLATLRL